MSENNDRVGKVAGFFLFRNVVDKYSDIKGDEGSRRDYKRFGRASIALSVVAIVLSVCMFLIFGVSAFGNFGLVGLGNVTSIIANIIAGILVPIILSIYSFVFAVLQIRLNRKACGVVGLVLSVIAMIMCIVALAFVFL